MTDLEADLGRGDPRVARLFPNYKAEEAAYFAKTGIFPIMHVLGFRQEVVERYPWVPVNVFQAFNEAKAIAMKRMENPRIVPLAWYRESWEEQEAILGKDPWEYGLTQRNVKNFERASRDRFFLCIEARDPKFESAQTFLESLKPIGVYEVER